MPITQFPDPSSADIDGIVAFGGDLHPESLLLAYRNGIFPWPIDGLPLPWFSPAQRGILVFSDLHVPRSLEKVRKKAPFRLSLDEDFPSVIQACAQVPRPDQPGTWITAPMLAAYIRLHEMGHAHSVEVWEGSHLVGGLYGVEVDGIFAGESMFHLRPNASKLAILYLVDHLRARGAEWIDIQTLTPHMEVLGAKVITRRRFLAKLRQTQEESKISGRTLF